MRKIEKIIENAVHGIKPTKKEMKKFYKWYEKEFGISAKPSSLTGKDSRREK